MTSDVEIVVDPDDSAEVIRALRLYAEVHPGALVVAIEPHAYGEAQTAWPILRALGKDLQNARHPSLTDAAVWLHAHQITRLIVLHAQYLRADQHHALLAACQSISADLTLLRTGAGADQVPATSNLHAVLVRAPPAAAPPPTSGPWPAVPHAHPLLFRTTCRKSLTGEDFGRVDQLLFSTMDSVERWLHAHQQPTPHQLAVLASVTTATLDPNQRWIRRHGLVIALSTTGRAPTATVPRLHEQSLTPAQITEASRHTDPRTAGYILARHLTGLTDDMIDLIGADQITENTMLGLEIPADATAILRALVRLGARPTAARRAHDGPDQVPSSGPESRGAPVTSPQLAQLLRGRDQRVHEDELRGPGRRIFRQLAAVRVLERHDSIYRASQEALYSVYRLRAPPIPTADVA